MAIELPWKKTLAAKLGGITFLLFTLSAILAVVNILAFFSLGKETAWVNYSGKARRAPYIILYLANRLFEAKGPARDLLLAELKEEIQNLGERLIILRDGDPAQRIPGATDAKMREFLKSLHDRFHNTIKPHLEKVIAAPSREAALADLNILDEALRTQSEESNQMVDLAVTYTNAAITWDQGLQFAFLGLDLVAVALVVWIVRGIVSRTRELVTTALRIAKGELELTARVGGSDELAILGNAFNTMTGNLRQTIDTEKKGRARIEQLLESIREAAGQLSAASAEILASTSQQAAGAQEQAAAVAQTVATVDEVGQTADQSIQRAKTVGDIVQRNLEIGKTGRKVVDDSLVAMEAVKEKVETTAENILTLAEQAQAIGDIIASVNDIAEQTNLLALNAAIEASRAGEHGKGFSVVAGEVKVLAGQSKKATGQVRQILGKIQKATNSAVLSTEEVTKGVGAAIKVGGQAGETIKALAETLTETARAVAQIAASVGQQATGMTQIHQAMKYIDQVAKQNTVATRQTAQAAENINTLGKKLTGLLAE